MRKRKVLSESEQLNQFIAEAVWGAWAAGCRVGSPMSSPRMHDREHAVVCAELEKVQKAVTRLLDKKQ